MNRPGFFCHPVNGKDQFNFQGNWNYFIRIETNSLINVTRSIFRKPNDQRQPVENKENYSLSSPAN